MSSFLVSYGTLRAAAIVGVEFASTPETASEAVAELAELNVDGFLTRYSNREDAAPRAAKWLEGVPADEPPPDDSDDALDRAYVALSCILYQATEGDLESRADYERWNGVLTAMATRIADRALALSKYGWGDM